MENLYYTHFSHIDFKDSFFDSLNNDYPGFSGWVEKKKNDPSALAYVLFNEQNCIEGFLYLKIENESITDVTPQLPMRKHLKVGTFKFESRGTLRGERFIKKIFDHALECNADDIYVTVYPKHAYLIRLFNSFGFDIVGLKGPADNAENVLLKEMQHPHLTGDIVNDYPFIHHSDSNRKFILSVDPSYHTNLFPDSILRTESPSIVSDVSHTNSIRKIYICAMQGVTSFRPNDIVLIYRTNKGLPGRAYYNSVITSLCVVNNVRHIEEFETEDSFINYCKKYSVFDVNNLSYFYRTKKYPFIVSFTYNIAFPKRPNRAKLISDVGLDSSAYWGVLDLSDQQFEHIIKLGAVDESIIIN